jgi:hypothetical protein
MPSANTLAQKPGGNLNPLLEHDALLAFFLGLAWL